MHSPDLTQVTHLPTRSESGPTSRDWLSMKLGVIVFICAPLWRRVIQLSPITLTVAIFFPPVPSLERVRIQEGSPCVMSYALGIQSWVPSVESPFLEGSGLPSFVPSPLWSLNLVPFWLTHQRTIPDEMIWIAAMLATFLVLLCIFHGSGKMHH